MEGVLRNETTGADLTLMTTDRPTTHHPPPATCHLPPATTRHPLAAPVPEPANVLLAALGFGGVLAGARRRPGRHRTSG